MKSLMLISLLCLLPVSGLHAAADFGTVPDPYTGNWSGTLTAGAKAEAIHATIMENKDGFEVTFRKQPDPRSDAVVVFPATVVDGGLTLAPSLSLDRSEVIGVQKGGVLIRTLLWKGRIEHGELTGSIEGRAEGTFDLRKVAFQPSPTLGAEAPAGAVVLFNGRNLDAWEPKGAPDDPIQWKLTDSGVLEVVSTVKGKRNKQDLKTRALFGDYALHLEFKLAHLPAATGQGRSNSGIFHQGVYETQILDSFGLYGRDNECGGIYKTREPDHNAAFPAGLWQTYDIELTAPVFDAKGQKKQNARMTVRLNGVLIHDDVEVPKPTAGGREAARGPVILQDHGSPVQFRNIWIREK